MPTRADMYKTYKKCPKCGFYQADTYNSMEYLSSTDVDATYKETVNYICLSCKNRWTNHNQVEDISSTTRRTNGKNKH